MGSSALSMGSDTLSMGSVQCAATADCGVCSEQCGVCSVQILPCLHSRIQTGRGHDAMASIHRTGNLATKTYKQTCLHYINTTISELTTQR